MRGFQDSLWCGALKAYINRLYCNKLKSYGKVRNKRDDKFLSSLKKWRKIFFCFVTSVGHGDSDFFLYGKVVVTNDIFLSQT